MAQVELCDYKFEFHDLIGYDFATLNLYDNTGQLPCQMKQ